jgi:branched-subunit amino acid ABC-type transport system permease component
MMAAVSMLVVEDVVASVWSPLWSEVVFFAALVVVLTLRPQGLFGRTFSRAQ